MKKQTKKVAKTTNKTKTELVVNLYDVNDIDDLYFNFAIAKCNANIPLTETEFTTVYTRGASDALKFAIEITAFTKMIDSITDKFKTPETIEEPVEKKAWYKRLWEKITKPFRKSK